MSEEIVGKMPMLDLVHERLRCRFKKRLSTELNKKVGLNIVSTDILPFGQLVNSFPIPTYTSILNSEDMGICMLFFDSKLVAHLLHLPIPEGRDQKDFIGTELALLDFISRLALKDLKKAWGLVHSTKFKVVGTNLNPQCLIPVTKVPANETMISATFEIKLDMSSNLTVVYPYSTLEPIKDKLNPLFMRFT